MYIYELDNWPKFEWNPETILDLLVPLRHAQGRLLGRMESVGFDLRIESTLKALTQDVLKTSEIEGVILNPSSVRSSIVQRLGLEAEGSSPVDRAVEGVVEMMLDATSNYEKPLTKERLVSWHAALFPTGYSGLSSIVVANWRQGPMKVVSEYFGRENIHFEAPVSDRVDFEMTRFLEWFNGDTVSDLILKSAIAHLWFLTIHPFDDGNGRIARALTDLLLARSENSAQRFYSLSAQIQRERLDYYAILEQSQKGTLDITSWLQWYLKCLERAIVQTDETLTTIFVKDQFWKRLKMVSVSDRQRKIINKLLDGEFFGVLTSSKWAKISKCSQDTAHRDIQDLINKGIIVQNESGGRSTSYRLNL